MKKIEIIELINMAVKSKEICRIFFKYNYYYSYHFPLITSEKLFLSANEDDFIIDGFTVRRFCDIKKLEIKNDKCVEIIKYEGGNKKSESKEDVKEAVKLAKQITQKEIEELAPFSTNESFEYDKK